MKVVNKLSISQAQLVRLVTRASTLYERLDREVFSFSLEPVNEQLLQSRVEAWCQAVAKEDFDHFERCLQWDGLNIDQAKTALKSVCWRENAPLPDWAINFSSIIELADAAVAFETNPDKKSKHRFLDLENPLPFEEILTPFVLFASSQLESKAGNCARRLTNQVQGILERKLLAQLIDTATKPLQLTFASWRSVYQSSLTRLLAQKQETKSNRFYIQFVREMLEGKLVDFFLEYSALARLLTIQTQLWVESQYEFLDRLNQDWSAIENTFGKGATLGKVIDIQPFLSDPHRGRRSVIGLKIEPNLRLIYKPKHLGIEKAYNELLIWLNQRDCSLPLKSLQIIDSKTHGWVEFVEGIPCKDQAEIDRHYQRVGMLLCLIYALDGTDCHYENFIASGEHPLLIDNETLMQHRLDIEFPVESRHTAQNLAFYQMANSVMRTAMLPSWHEDFDYSGLGSHQQQTRSSKGWQWSLINTDQMTLNLKESEISPPSNQIPTLNGEVTTLSDSIEQVVDGFDRMYRFLLERKDELLAKDSPLWKIAEQTVRFVFRATNIYFKIFDKLSAPEYLREGVDRSIGLEIIKRSAINENNKPIFWSILRAERQQMEQLDIPFFTTCPNKDILNLSTEKTLAGFFDSSSFKFVLNRIESLNEADLKMQLQLIEGSLYSRIIRIERKLTTSKQLDLQTPVDVREKPKVTLDDSALFAEVMAIARRLQERAISASDGSVTWLAPQFVPQQEMFQYLPTNFSLYDGKLGIALFLAALQHITGDGEFRELCLGTLKEFRQTILNPEQTVKKSTSNWDLGFSNGLGGSIYALTKISQFLGDRSLIVDALNLARTIEPEMIQSDRFLDIISGAAGSILGLLALYEVTGEKFVLEAANHLGNHLLDRSEIASVGRAWKTIDSRFLTGFSHGAGGIAYVLLKLAKLTDNAEFHKAATEAIAYENSLFITSKGNWPDLRDFSKIVVEADRKSDLLTGMSSWCHGATGIGLARLGGLASFANESIDRDIEVAISTTKAHLNNRNGSLDHLCCGSMGQIEFLLCAVSLIGKRELITDAKVYASEILQQAKQKGYYLEPALPASVYAPGFFRGESGIGYTLLRSIHLKRLPSILLGE